MAFSDAWIAEVDQGSADAQSIKTATSMSGSEGLQRTSNQHVRETPHRADRGGHEGTRLRNVGLFKEEDAALEEMDCR